MEVVEDRLLTAMPLDPKVVESLRAAVGERGLVIERTRRATYESDGLAHARQVPELVVLPRTTAEAAAVMRILHDALLPVVSRGAGTGLSGGATPVAGGVVVGTARMRDVLEIDAENRFARVQAGVVNADLSLACAPHGLFYAPDPSSQKACTIGGNVAENSGGPHCFKHGSTTQHVQGLVFVMADGHVLDLSRPRLEPDGYDLLGLLVGAEGTLGLATEVTVRLLPLPEATETLLAIFERLDDACEAVTHMIESRLEPSAIEILDKLTIEAIEASVLAAGYPKNAGAVLLIDVEGSNTDVEGITREALEIVLEHGAFETRRARDANERARLWAGRKGAYGAMGRIAPDLYVSDAVVPRTRLRELVRATTEICERKGLKVANVFHAGDGNLHPNIAYDRRDKDELARVLEAGDEILRACLAAGGSLTGEHGVGLEKLEAMEWLFTRDDLAAMCRARDAFDPARRMNPRQIAAAARVSGDARASAVERNAVVSDWSARLAGVVDGGAKHVATRTAFGRELPLVAPGSEEELAEITRFAAGERLALTPIGLGTKLGWRARPTRIDFLITTRRLSGVVAHEPNDGVITARAGTSWNELERTARASGHHLSPALPSSIPATLGGVIGAGQSGFDRLRHGPLRHQVLGLRTIQADGTSVKSGGRLVKNVTGYDLHRLHTGAHGTLGIVVEASLRLHPAPRSFAIVMLSTPVRQCAIESARALLALPLAPRCVVVHDLCPAKSGASWALHAVLAGRPATVARECEIAQARLPSSTIYRGEMHRSPVEQIEREIGGLEHRDHDWPTCEIACLPARLAAVLDELDARCATLELFVRALLNPGLGSAALWLRDGNGTLTASNALAMHEWARERELELRWRALEDDVRARVDSVPYERAGERALQALKRSFDPHGTFAGGP